MPLTAELMREIHRLRKFARDLKEQIDRAPLQLKAQQAKVARQQEALNSNAEAIKKLKVTLHEKEVTLKTTHGQIAKHQKQLNEAGVQERIRRAANGNRQRPRKVYAVGRRKPRRDGRERRTHRQDSRIGKSRQSGERSLRPVRERIGIAPGVAQATDRRDASQAERGRGERPDQRASVFDRIVKGKGADAFAPVVDRGCGACRTEIIAQQYNELLMGAFVVCKMCGRICTCPNSRRRRTSRNSGQNR